MLLKDFMGGRKEHMLLWVILTTLFDGNDSAASPSDWRFPVLIQVLQLNVHRNTGDNLERNDCRWYSVNEFSAKAPYSLGPYRIFYTGD